MFGMIRLIFVHDGDTSLILFVGVFVFVVVVRVGEDSFVFVVFRAYRFGFYSYFGDGDVELRAAFATVSACFSFVVKTICNDWIERYEKCHHHSIIIILLSIVIGDDRNDVDENDNIMVM